MRASSAASASSSAASCRAMASTLALCCELISSSACSVSWHCWMRNRLDSSSFAKISRSCAGVSKNMGISSSASGSSGSGMSASAGAGGTAASARGATSGAA